MVVPLAMQLYRIVMVTDDYWALVQGRVVLKVEWLFDVSCLESLQSDLMGWLHVIKPPSIKLVLHNIYRLNIPQIAVISNALLTDGTG